MILQQNIPFSQGHKENLELLNFPIGKDAAASNLKQAQSALGAYFSVNNHRYIDLSTHNLVNPLGHNHPLNVLGQFEQTHFLDYQLSELQTDLESESFITNPSEPFESIKRSDEEVSFKNFHGFSFKLKKSNQSNEVHSIYSYLSYYSKLKIFEPNEYYFTLTKELGSVIEEKNAELHGLTIKLKKNIEPDHFIKEGIYIGSSSTNILYLPVALLLKDVSYLGYSINEVLCSY